MAVAFTSEQTFQTISEILDYATCVINFNPDLLNKRLTCAFHMQTNTSNSKLDLRLYQAVLLTFSRLYKESSE